MAKRPPTQYRDDESGHHLSIYDGRRLLGYLVERDREVHAYAAGGGFIGTFPRRDEARRALTGTPAPADGVRAA